MSPVHPQSTALPPLLHLHRNKTTVESEPRREVPM